MTVYVDALMHSGWQMHGRPIQSCHMFTDAEDLDELHVIAKAIGLRRAWFQGRASTPRYVLTPGKRAQAIIAGAVPVGRSEAVRIWRKLRARPRQEVDA
jgi:hypothetical protein